MRQQSVGAGFADHGCLFVLAVTQEPDNPVLIRVEFAHAMFVEEMTIQPSEFVAHNQACGLKAFLEAIRLAGSLAHAGLHLLLLGQQQLVHKSTQQPVPVNCNLHHRRQHDAVCTILRVDSEKIRWLEPHPEFACLRNHINVQHLP